MPDTLQVTEALLEKITSSISKLINWSEQLAHSTDKDTKAFQKFDDEITALSNDLEKTRKAWEKATSAHINWSKEVLKGSKNLSSYKKLLREEIDTLVALEKIHREEARSRDAIRKIVERETETRGAYVKRLGEEANAIRGVMGLALSYGKVFGAQGVTLEGIKDKVVKYNQSLFDLTRTQKRMGSGTKDIQSALELASKTTYMSRNQTLEFANSMNKLYVGVKPTTTEFVKLASAIQREFGPSMETTREIAQDLMSVQAEWPSLYDSILAAHERMVKGIQSGDREAIDSATSLGASNLMNLVAMGASKKTIEDVMRLQAAQTDGTGELADLNKDVAKNMQTAEDAILSAGKKAEGAMELAAKATGAFLEVMKALPGATAMTAASFGLINLALSSEILRVKDLIKSYIELNAIRRSGSMGGAVPPPLPRTAGGAGGAVPTSLPGTVGGSATTLPAAAGRAGLFGTKFGAGIQASGAVQGIAGIKLVADAMGGLNAAMDEQVRLAQEQKIMEEGFLGRISTGITESGTTIATLLNSELDFVKSTWKEGVTVKNIKEANKELTKVTRGIVGTERYEEIKKRMTEEYEREESLGKTPRAAGKFFGEDKRLTASWKEDAIARMIIKAVREEQKWHKDQIQSRKHAQETADSINKSVLAYTQIKTEAEARLKIDQQILESLNAQLAVAEEFGSINQDILKSRKDAAQASLKDIQDQINGFKQLAPTLETLIPKEYKEVGIDVSVSGLDSLEDINKKMAIAEKQIQTYIDKRKEEENLRFGGLTEEQQKSQIERERHQEIINKLESDEKRIVGAIAEGQKLAKAETQARATVTRATVDTAYKGVEQQEKYNSMISSTLDLERQVMEAGQYGLGASVKMMQQQADLAYERINQLQKGDRLMREELVANRKLNSQAYDAIDAAKSFDEIQAAITAEIAKQNVTGQEATDVQQALVAYSEKHNKTQQQIHQQQLKIYEITKEVREGYLSAMKQMAVGSSQFSKIIGTQTRGAKQLMDVVEVATGQKQLNTMLMGGTVRKGGGMTTPFGQMTTEGFRAGYTPEQQAAFFSQNIYDYGNVRQGRPQVGAALGPTAAQAPYIAAAAAGGGGGVVRPPATTVDLSSFTQRIGAGKPMPVERGPANIAGQTAIGVAAARGSTASAVSGPPALQPTGKDKLDVVSDKLETVAKLLGDIKSGIPVYMQK